MRYLIFIFAIILVSCTKSGENKDFSSYQSKWNKQDIVNYEFTLTVSCFCPQEIAGPHIIKVVNDTIESVNNQPYDPETQGLLMTIDELFTYVGQSIDRNPYKQTIEYNSTYGYPEYVFFDFVKTMVDEEIGYQITGFIKN